MNISEYKQGIDLLRNDDNEIWVNKVSCWRQDEDEYAIYCFSVIIESEDELRQIYKSITAAIATEFQTTIDKPIEKWNIYLIFETAKNISIELKDEIEQNKYSTRKLVWDKLEYSDMNNADYLSQRLLSLNIKENIKYRINSGYHLFDKIKEVDSSLYDAIVAPTEEIEKMAAIYLGGK